MVPEGRIAVVTDDGGCLPEAMARESGIQVVSLPTEAGPSSSLDEPIRTSRPTPAAFAARYRSLLDAGATGIVSVHLSALLSGTCDSARAAARQVAPDRIRVIDSRTAGMGLGFAALDAGRAALDGGSLSQVRAAAADTADASTVLFTVSSLDQLRRGGRIGPAAAFVGGVLAVRPVLVVCDGEVVLAAKVRTARRAAGWLEDAAVDAEGPDEPGAARLAVHHLDAADAAAALAERIRHRSPHVGAVPIIELSAAVGAHTGPGTLGVVIVRCPTGAGRHGAVDDDGGEDADRSD